MHVYAYDDYDRSTAEHVVHVIVSGIRRLCYHELSCIGFDIKKIKVYAWHASDE